MAVLTLRAVPLPSGQTVPVLGQGTSHLGQGRHDPEEEQQALRLGLDLGMALIDTSETYGGGAAERLVGRAIEGRRDEVFLVGQVMAEHATREGTHAAFRRSLERLNTDRLDLYLLDGPRRHALEDTLRAFEDLRGEGLIGGWGVTNFDIAMLAGLVEMPSGKSVQTDQVLYNLNHRGIEWDLLPLCQQAGVPVMAYSPFDEGRLVGHPVLRGIAVRHHTSSAQVALAWVLSRARVIAIAEAGTPEHVRANREALDLRLAEDDLLELDAAFEPPAGPVPLERL